MQLLLNNQINKKQWDECIHNAADGLIYATSGYLDQLSPGWLGLTGPDYSWVMPVTHRRKYGIDYLYQPSFAQQFGVFASSPGVAVPWEDVAGFLKRRYRFWEINLHLAAWGKLGDVQMQKANNFVVDLERDYKSICAGYATIFVKNLKRARNAGLVYTSELGFQKCIDLYRQYYGQRVPHVRETDYLNFTQLCRQLERNGQVVCRGVQNPSGELTAAVLLLTDKRRLYNLMNVTLTGGKANQSNHFLFDQVIREFQGSGRVLDLEGSDLPGVKQFYEGLGSKNEPYYKVKYNGLPWPLRLLKK